MSFILEYSSGGNNFHIVTSPFIVWDKLDLLKEGMWGIALERSNNPSFTSSEFTFGKVGARKGISYKVEVNWH